MLDALAPLVSFNSPLQLAFDNISIVLIEVVSYFCFLMACIHASGSPRRSQLLLGALIVYHTLWIGLAQVDSHLAIVWHGQAMIMLFFSHVPLYVILLNASLYYMVYIATLKMQLHFSSSMATMGLLVMAVIFPAELLGSKLLWWTWHDTDPILADRFLNVPTAIMASHFLSAISLYASVQILQPHFAPGLVYQESAARAEYGVYLGAIFISVPVSMLLFGLSYQLFCLVLGVSSLVFMAGLIAVSSYLWWSSDRRDGQSQELLPWHYDGEWFHKWYDHALLQFFYLYMFITLVILLAIQPSQLVSLGYHQLIGDCRHTTSYSTVLGTTLTRFTYLCKLHFDEAYSLCDAPRSQLHVMDPWYKICGVPYHHDAFADYVFVMVVLNGCLVFIFREIFTLARPAWVQRLPKHK
ncbi:hypothetical protein AeNC1_013756 [Aphanomyces euteiches]|nr:hypothetical protein AeNC1_013756 [Aphanomyces euteiches]